MGCAASRPAVLADDPRAIGQAGITKAQTRQVQQPEKNLPQYAKGKQSVSHQPGSRDPRGHGTAPVLFGSETTTSVQSFTIAASGALICYIQLVSITDAEPFPSKISPLHMFTATDVQKCTCTAKQPDIVRCMLMTRSSVHARYVCKDTRYKYLSRMISHLPAVHIDDIVVKHYLPD